MAGNRNCPKIPVNICNNKLSKKKFSHGAGTANRSQKDGHCRTGVRCQLGLFHFAPTNRINSDQKSCVFVISE